MADRPVILYDTTLRDGTQGENITLSLADKLRVARMLDEYGFPFIEGGWPGSNPKDVEFFAAARDDALGAGEARRVRVHPPPVQQARRGPQPARARRGRDAGRHDLRQELAAPRDRGPGRDARREPRHDRGLGGLRRGPRPRGRVRRGALLRRLQGRPRLRAVHAPGRPPGRRPDARPVRHERRHADRRARPGHRRRPRLPRGRPRRARGRVGDPHPQRRGARGRELDRGRPGRRSATSRRRSTATASAAATRTWSRSSPTSRSRRPSALVPPGGGSLAALTELSRSVAEIANVAPNDYQPYVGRSAFAHKGGVHGAAVAKVERSYQHVDPVSVGNAGRLVVSELGGQGEHRDPGPPAGPRARGHRPPRAEQAHQADGARRAGVRGRGGELRAPHPTPDGGTTRPRSRSSTTPASWSSGRAASCSPRRRSRSRSRARCSTPPRTATARSTRSTARCARRSGRSTRCSTRSTSSTTRSASSTGRPRRPPGRASSSTRRTAPAPGPPWAATRTSSRPRPRRSPTRWSTRSGSPGPSSGGATSATSRRPTGSPPRAAPGGQA